MNLIELKDVVTVLKKYTRTILITMFMFTLLGATLSYLMPPIFQAKSDILVSYSYSKTDVQAISVSEIDSNLRLVETYKYILKSDRVLEKLAEEIGYSGTLEDLAKQINIETNGQSQIITITAQDRSYMQAERLANSTALIFQKEIQDLMKVNNVQILTEEKKDMKATHVKPNHVFYIVIAFLLGAILSIMIVFVKETLFARTDSIERVEKISQLPVLGVIPEMVSAKTLPEILDDLPMVESYREIHHMLQHAMNKEHFKTILFTSPNPREGKSLTAGNVAIYMAMQGKKVVFIDADLRKGIGTVLFNLLNKKGLTNYLDEYMDLKDIIQSTEIPNLSFISKGANVYNGVDLLTSTKMDQLLEQLKQEFDVILIDSPSLLVTDAVFLATKVDRSILVVNAKRTKLDQVVKSIQKLGKVQANIQGIIMNYGKRNDKKRY